jgi:hypothetical protein
VEIQSLNRPSDQARASVIEMTAYRADEVFGAREAGQSGMPALTCSGGSVCTARVASGGFAAEAPDDRSVHGIPPGGDRINRRMACDLYRKVPRCQWHPVEDHALACPTRTDQQAGLVDARSEGSL